MASLESVRDRVRAAIARGDYPLAGQGIELIQRYFPRELETELLLGHLHLARGCWPAARHSLVAVLEVDPERVAARAGLALLSEEEGDPDGALEQWERAFDLEGFNHELAVEVCRLSSRGCRTLSVGPGSPQHALARSLVREGRYRRAVGLFEEAARGAPERVEITVGWAESLWLAGRREEAAQVAAGVLPDHPHCLKMLSILAGASFSRREAEALFLLRKTDEFDPGNPRSRRLFLDAGLPFPRVGVDAEIPGDELRRVMGAALLDRSAMGDLEAGDRDEAEWEGDEETEPFILPEIQMAGEWVRDRPRSTGEKE